MQETTPRPAWLDRADLPWRRVRSTDAFEAQLVRRFPDEWEPDRRNKGSRTLWPGGGRLIFEQGPPLWLTRRDCCRVLLARDGTPLAVLRVRHVPLKDRPGHHLTIREAAVLAPTGGPDAEGG